MKTALLLCSSHNDLGLIRALKKLGFYIIVTGNIENLPGQKDCDKFIKADYSDKELILKIAKDNNIDYIIQCCNDFGVYTAAYVAEKLGLPGYDSYAITLLLHNKDMFKQFAKEYDLLSPISESFAYKETATIYAKTAEYPIIIKPVDLSAGNGISKAENFEQAEAAINEAFEKSRAKRIVIEPFINGEQGGFCTFLINKKVVAYCSNNEYSFLNPYRVEIDTFPAKNNERISSALIPQVEKIASLLNLKDGIFHLQYIDDGKTPYIIEVMRRILGNMYHVPGNKLADIDWEYWETRARCGLSLEEFPTNKKFNGFFSYKTIVAEKNGKINKIAIPENLEKYCFEKYFLKQGGDEITNYMSQPIGFLFMQFSSQEEMHDVLIEKYKSDFVEMVSEDKQAGLETALYAV